jgi:hypothetical protein
MANTYTGKNPDSTFPAPKFIKVFDKPGKKNAVLFFRYWASIPAEKQDLIEVKVYRTWPQVDVKLTEPNRKDITWDIIEGKLPFDPPEDYQTYFLEKYFSGEWNVILNEKGVKGKIMEAFFDATDMEKFPPRVDLRTVLWDKTANRDYKRWCEQKRIQIPGQEGADFQEAQEMNAGMTVVGNAMETLAEQNKEALAENRALVREVFETKLDAQKPSDASASVVSKTVEMMADAGSAAVKMVTESAPKAYDPLPMVREIFTLTKGNDNSGVMMQMFITSMEKQNQAMVKMHEDTLAYMKTRDEKLQTAVVPFKSGIDLLIEEAPKLEAVKNLFGWGSRRNLEEHVPMPEPKSQWLEKLVEKPENLQAVVGLFALASNMLATILGKGKPAEEVLQNVGVVPAPSSPAPAPNGSASAPEPPRQPTQAELNQMFLEFIEPVFLEHFFDNQKRGLNGASFAKALLSIVQTPDGTQWAAGPETPVGRQQYGLISADPKGFDRLLRSYSPIWGQVSAFAVQRSDSKEAPRYFQFLNDFFSFDQMAAKA